MEPYFAMINGFMRFAYAVDRRHSKVVSAKELSLLPFCSYICFTKPNKGDTEKSERRFFPGKRD